MATVDNAPGSHASGALGGGSGDDGGRGGDGGSGKKGGPKGHYTGLQDITELAASPRKTIRTTDIRDAMKYHLVKNQVIFKDGRGAVLSKHWSHNPATTIQARGDPNDPPCTSCEKGNGCMKGCISFHRGDVPDDPERALFGGACGNCFWGGQGSKCSVRKGGARIPPRKMPAGDLFQIPELARTHIGGNFNLDTVEDCKNAIDEMNSIIRALRTRMNSIEKGKSVPPIEMSGEVVNSGSFGNPDEDDDLGFPGDFDTLVRDIASPIVRATRSRTRARQQAHQRNISNAMSDLNLEPLPSMSGGRSPGPASPRSLSNVMDSSRFRPDNPPFTFPAAPPRNVPAASQSAPGPQEQPGSNDNQSQSQGQPQPQGQQQQGQQGYRGQSRGSFRGKHTRFD